MDRARERVEHVPPLADDHLEGLVVLVATALTALRGRAVVQRMGDIDGDGRPDLVQTGDPARTGGYVFGAGTATPGSWRVFLGR